MYAGVHCAAVFVVLIGRREIGSLGHLCYTVIENYLQ